MSKKHLSAFACLLAAAACGATVLAQSSPKAEGARQRRQGEPVRRAMSQVWTLGGGNFLGVQLEELTRENMARFQVSGEPRGVGVGEVAEGGPAAKAGLQKGDVIVRFDSEAVTSGAKLRRLVAEAAPEQSVRLAILRGGAEREVVVKLGRRAEGAFENFRLPEGQVFEMDGDEWEKQSEAWKKFGDEWKKQGEAWKKQGEAWKIDGDELRRQLESMPQLDNLPRGNFAFAFASGRRIGVATTALTDQLADYFGVSERRGLLVTSVAADSPAAKAGIKAGDVITEADGEKIDDATELSRVIGRKDAGDVTLSIVRDRARRTVRVTPEKRERPEVIPLDDRPDGPAAGLFALPRAGGRGGRAFVRPSSRVVVAPRLVAPRVLIPSRARTVIL